EMVIGGLQSDTTYSITVAAYTTKGDGARSKSKLVDPDPDPDETQTAAERARESPRGCVFCRDVSAESEIVPGPPYLSVAQDSETSAVVCWDTPDVMIPGMELQGYRLQFGRKDVSPLATLEFTPQERKYTVASVHRGATYLFKVQAKSRGGFGEEATAELQVPEHTPQGYPQISESSNVTCCSVELAWSPPVLAERNGDITEYTLAYQETGVGGTPRELSLPASQSTYVLNSLKTQLGVRRENPRAHECRSRALQPADPVSDCGV
ncbi:unnamed protein product, partial [Coregonus sp. 'balchen']